MKYGIDIRNLHDVVAKLDRLEELHKLDELPDALAAGALIAVEDAKAAVPVRTGDLQRSIHIGGYTRLTPDYRPNGAYGALPGPEGSGRKVGVLMGTRLPYAPLVELGTRRTRRRPFLKPAVDNNRRAITDAVDDALQEIIDG